MTSKPFQTTRGFSDFLIADHTELHIFDDFESLFDWSALERRLSVISASPKGRPSYPLLMLFRALLLGQLHAIASDVKLEAMLARDLAFRKFCGIAPDQVPPSHDTLSRFRRELAAHNLWEDLLQEVNEQLADKNIMIKEGQVNIMDATIVEAHQIKGKTKDPEAGWNVKTNARGKKQHTYSYKVHTSCDEDGFILSQDVTSGEVHEKHAKVNLLTGEESELYADSAYDSFEFRDFMAARGVKYCVQRKGCLHKKLTEEDHAWNELVGVMRSKIEHQYAEYKERYGLRRTRFMGLLMNATHAGLTAIAHNIKKGVRFYQLYGLA